MDDKTIVYCDMDGVLADFYGSIPRQDVEWNPPEMFEVGFYRDLGVMPGAKDAIAELLANPKIDLFIASKPTTKNLWCPTEKYQWIEEHFPVLLKKMFLCCDKGHLNGDYLIDDDHDRWANLFQGGFLHFDEKNPIGSWERILKYLRRYK